MSKNVIASIIQDTALITGAFLASYGVFEIYRPAGFICAGCFIMYAAFPRRAGK